jgi:two-component system, response regulator PdtaR
MIWIREMNDQIASAVPAVVLIVEDEWLLRELAVELVEEAGFVALQARDAEEAVALLEARSDIAVLFTDINMPGHIDGLELAHKVRDRWPSIKILVASGRFRLKQCDLPPTSAFLEKPYRGEALIALLRSLVGPTRNLIGSDLIS